jgi:hypothetical protein
MTSNEKRLNYKVIDLVKCYNVHINFISIQVHTQKSYDLLKRTEPTAISHDVCSTTVPTPGYCSHAVWYGPNAIPHGGNGIFLQNLR